MIGPRDCRLPASVQRRALHGKGSNRKPSWHSRDPSIEGKFQNSDMDNLLSYSESSYFHGYDNLKRRGPEEPGLRPWRDNHHKDKEGKLSKPYEFDHRRAHSAHLPGENKKTKYEMNTKNLNKSFYLRRRRNYMKIHYEIPITTNNELGVMYAPYNMDPQDIIERDRKLES